MRDLPSTLFRLLSRAVPLLLVFGLTAAKEPTPGEILWQEGVAYRSEGRQLQEAGDLQRATAAYRHAVGTNPRYAEAYNDLGVVLESTGDLLHAEEAYKTALKLKPELAAAHSNLALLYEENGRLQEAADHWAARVRMGPAADVWVARAREKLIRHNLSVPESVEESAAKRQNEARQAIQAGRAHLEAKRWEQAQSEFQRALSLDPGSREAARLLHQAQSLVEEDKARTERQLKASQSRVQKEAVEARREESTRQQKEVQRREEAQKKALEAVGAQQKEPPPRASAQRLPLSEAAPRASAQQPAPSDALAVAEEYAREKARARRTTVKELYELAAAAMREGQYQDAADHYSQILMLDPGNRDAQRGLERAQKALAK